jgi:hypothetical protein
VMPMLFDCGLFDLLGNQILDPQNPRYGVSCLGCLGLGLPNHPSVVFDSSRGLSARSDSKPEIRSTYLRTLILFGSRTGLPHPQKAEAKRCDLTVTSTDARECYRGPPILQCRSLGKFLQGLFSCR